MGESEMKRKRGKGAKWRQLGKAGLVGLVLGIVLGVGGTIFLQNFNPADEKSLTPSAVFSRIASQNEMVSASQDYMIVEKVTDTNTFFDLFDIPFTQNSFWYRYVGTIKAGVNLENADFSLVGNTITVALDDPHVISNTPDMEQSGALEENNNILNPIHVADVDEFQAQCIEESQAKATEGGLMEEARQNAEENIRDMFFAAFGDAYAVSFVWRQAA